MRTENFDYELPRELIAQRPLDARDASRLMIVRGTAGGEPPTPFEHRVFRDLPDCLRAGDLLVVNDTRVLAARVAARRATGGAVELLFIGPVDGAGRQWRALVRPARRVRPGDELTVGGTAIRVMAALPGGERCVELPEVTDPLAWLEEHGTMPLPPYIHPEDDAAREAFDRERYQTVYARRPGAVAAPTAGLHFTPELFDRLEANDIEVATLTLEVGPGTFRPVATDEIEEHEMDGERYRMPRATVATVAAAVAAGRRVVAVGTTVVRTLEHAATAGAFAAEAADVEDVADLYITPGYEFRIVNAMITNLHLPRSTPILMAAALVGRERLLAAYAAAVERRYRFYSYGDAMFLIP